MKPLITQISTDVVARNKVTKQSPAVFSLRLPRLTARNDTCIIRVIGSIRG